jgi:Tfp pilus assembly protein PilN
MTMPNVQGQVGHPLLTAASPRVNLMPPEIAEASKFRRFQFVMGATLVGAAGIVAALYVNAHHEVNSAKSQLQTAQADATHLQGQLNGLQSVQAVYSQVAARQTMLAQAMGGEVRWSYYLNDLSLKIPTNVWLTNVAATETPGAPSAAGTTAGIGTITFGGIAFSHDDVATWLDVLAREHGYANPYFSNSTEGLIGARKIVNFTSSVVLTTDAESGRYKAGS